MEDGGIQLFRWVIPAQRANPKSPRVIGFECLISDGGGAKEQYRGNQRLIMAAMALLLVKTEI